MTCASDLQTPDILLLILSLLDPATLTSFRLTSHRINSVITAHQKLICNSIALRTYSTPLDFLPSPDSLLSVPGLGNLYIKTLLRMPRARLLADRAVSNRYLSFFGEGPLPPDAVEQRPRCTRGLLVFWALVDIQQSVNHDEAPAPRYTPPAAVFMTKPRRLVARLFRSRKRVSATKSLSTCAAAPSLSIVDAPSAPLGGSRRSSGGSATSVAQRFAAVKAAQAPFAALLSRLARIDLEVAQGYLHGLMPFGCVGCKYSMPLEYAENSWWRESWALRQGPAFMLSVSSADPRERLWADQTMQQEWGSRAKEVLEVERTTPIFLFEDKEMGKGGIRPLWVEGWDVRGGR
ncbi:hypothetical protein MMC18_000578 [Xylographa bjoerkii]|nr:hypothetical protein [Xylographa bjoerkii]